MYFEVTENTIFKKMSQMAVCAWNLSEVEVKTELAGQ